MTAKLSTLLTRRTRQPVTPVGVDWSNPLARGLQTLFDGASCRDVVSKRPFAPRNPAAGRAGMGHQVGGVTTVAQLANQVFKAGSGLTIFVFLEHGTATGTNTALTGRGSGAGGTATLLGVDDSGNLIVFDGAVSSTLGTQQAAGLHSYAITNQGTSLLGYVDGKLSGSAGSFSVVVDSAAQSMQIGAGAADELTAYMAGRYYLVVWWNRALTAGEIMALHANPWQLFAPEFVPSFTPVVTAQYVRPISDVSAGIWTASTGSDLFAMIDETAADDGDYITTTGASICEVSLGYLDDPGVNTGHVVRYRISATAGGMIVRLRNNGNTIASWTHDPAPSSPTTYAQTLTGGEADAANFAFPFSYQFEAIS